MRVFCPEMDCLEGIMYGGGFVRGGFVRAPTKHAVNNMASLFELNAHPYLLSNLFTGLHANVDSHNSLLESICAGEEKRERFAELDHQLQVQMEMVLMLPQGTTTTVCIRNPTVVIQMTAGGGLN